MQISVPEDQPVHLGSHSLLNFDCEQHAQSPLICFLFQHLSDNSSIDHGFDHLSESSIFVDPSTLLQLAYAPLSTSDVQILCIPPPPLDSSTMTEFPITEGEVDFEVPNAGKPCKTWYKILGSLQETTAPVLIGLHGGPGSGHEYLAPLADLYRPYGIPTLLYDQIGCGRSTHLREKMGDAEFWSFDLFIKELDNLIDHLDIRKRGFFLLGQSWGGVLGASYAMSGGDGGSPPGLKKLVISSGPSSIPLYGESHALLITPSHPFRSPIPLETMLHAL